jgi:hypothetical protein
LLLGVQYGLDIDFFDSENEKVTCRWSTISFLGQNTGPNKAKLIRLDKIRTILDYHMVQLKIWSTCTLFTIYNVWNK